MESNDLPGTPSKNKMKTIKQNTKHEPKCWTGNVESIVTSMSPAHQSDFDSEEECVECMVLRGELEPDPDNFPLLRKVKLPEKGLKPESFWKKLFK